VLGHLVALFTTLKALPLAYMRDLQEDKPAVYAAVRATESSLAVMAGALAEAQFLPVPLAAGDPMVATELADALVRRGLPFREAHRLVAELVRLAEARGGGLERLTEDDLRKTAPDLLTDLASLLDPQQAVHRRSAYGGTAPAAVAEQKRLLKARLAELEGALKAAEGPPSV
jgi:argininosuccinate lyase